jgi:fatty-acyl-CoA synthase
MTPPHLHAPISYSDVVLSALGRFPERVAFRQDGRDLTYRQTSELIARYVAVLHRRGLRRNEGIGVLSPNRPEVWIAQTAAVLAGGRFTALHPLGSLDDHLYACNEAELRFVLVDPAYAERAASLREASPAVEQVLTFGPAEIGDDLAALSGAEPSPPPLGPGPHGPEDVAWLLYTGGTTGVPKAAMLPQRAVAQLVYGVATGWDLPADRRYLACAPISHAAGMLIVPTLLRGGTVILQRGFDPEAWLRAVASERATLSLLVPTMIYALLDHPALERADLASLETVMYGASPMSPARMAEALERVGPVFCQLYGQTESGGQGTSLWRAEHDRRDLRRLASCGKPMPSVRVAILDEDGNPVPEETPGEICLQGPSLMLGYYRQPELTAAAFQNGWLRSGDVAVRDDQGFLTIVDRKKDMIVSGGFNVFPREIEDVLTSHPAVSMAAVIGVPDAKWGEAVKALVVVKPGAVLAPAELIALVKDRKGPVYAPKSVELVDSLPLTPVGKADKKVLRARYWQGETRAVH